ncbi:hypothetical protein HZH68_014030 [Vespula germanica]|uniref:Uncharacterized protein n=1 Tax=Vespula germanica TaxID=30212 RepID=A0A834JCP2_VESGE|nr:hypothetical protein HZH68_014030 [Vespula germanica]
MLDFMSTEQSASHRYPSMTLLTVKEEEEEQEEEEEEEEEKEEKEEKEEIHVGDGDGVTTALDDENLTDARHSPTL